MIMIFDFYEYIVPCYTEQKPMVLNILYLFVSLVVCMLMLYVKNIRINSSKYSQVDVYSIKNLKKKFLFIQNYIAIFK